MRPRTAEKLLEAATKGEKLSTEDRRHVVAYLMSTQPELNNSDLAEWFGVSERTIRMDRQYVRDEMAKEIKDDDVANVIADIAFNFKRQLRDIEQSKAKSKSGTDTYLRHCQAALDLELKKVKAFQDLGYLPKNLGNMTKEIFEYAAIVDYKTGHADTKPTNTLTSEEQKHLEDLKNGKSPLLMAEYVEVEPLALPEPDEPDSSTRCVPQDESHTGNTEQEGEDSSPVPTASAH